VAPPQFREPHDLESVAGAAQFYVFDGAETGEVVAISTVFVETPSRPTMVNSVVTTGTTFCIDAAATPSVRPSVQPLQLRMEPFGWPCHAMFLVDRRFGGRSPGAVAG
jgi:hypothetical protein